MDYIQVDECLNLLHKLEDYGLSSFTTEEKMILTANMADIIRDIERSETHD